MSKEKEATHRRVYVLPQELVDRIVEFQKEKGYPSEVEAVRKLLDEALLHRDGSDSIIRRFKSRLSTLKMPAEVSKDVLVGHPLITDISFAPNSVQFTVKDDCKYRIYDTGTVHFFSTRENKWKEWVDWNDEVPF